MAAEACSPPRDALGAPERETKDAVGLLGRHRRAQFAAFSVISRAKPRHRRSYSLTNAVFCKFSGRQQEDCQPGDRWFKVASTSTRRTVVHDLATQLAPRAYQQATDGGIR